MIHKPKLVAVTGCSNGAGTSTLAAGLAAAFSETGDGKVLLVDMNVGRAEIHPFFRGTPSCSLSDALVGQPAPAGENLYLAVATPPGTRQGQIIPKKFYDLVPHLKASDFDYIIFDMPPLNQTSITLATAGYMDKVVLVAEAEKSNRQVVRRAYTELASVNANVSAVLNKLRFYAPKWLAVEGGQRSEVGIARTTVKLTSADELDVYKQAYNLAMRIFELSRCFPPEERFALTSQIRRSSRSVCLNLREAWAKRRYEAHFVSKLTDCDGENSETQSSLNFAKDCGYITDAQHEELRTLSRDVGKMLGRMMNNPHPFLISDR